MKMKNGIANLQDMTIKIQFDINATCKLIKIPTFNYSYKERESLGGGWYGSSKETVNATQENAYLVLHEDKPIGFIVTAQNGRVYIQGKNSNKFIKKYIADFISEQPLKQNKI
jgi:hypothetical protein